MEDQSPLLSVKDLKAYFHLDEGIVKAVDGVTFDIQAGHVLGIVGESGCGKSVTMKAILRILEPPGKIESGEIIWSRTVSAQNGSTIEETINLTKLDPHGKEMRAIRGAEIALIPQEPMSAFSPVHTIGNQLIEAIMLHRTKDKREARQIAIDLLRDVGIPMPEERLGAYSWQLSGGLRQRAMIAMALSCNPRLLIADEPTTAVDVTTQAQVLRLLRELQERRNAAIIFITHDLGVIAQVADYVVVMYLGLVMEQGAVDDIFHAPKHPYTQALLRSIPSINSIPHPFNKPRGCPFHPRCEQAIPGRCDERTPALLPVGAPGSAPVGGQQLASCFLYHDVERTS
jgi:oligopeptide/dipeptide ABC transporter ATP-binding protein